MSNNISNIQLVNADTLEFQDYQQSDEQLISSFEIQDIKFIPESSIIEYYVLDSNKNLLLSEYNWKKYSLVDNSVSINPKEDLTQYGFDEGQYYSLYHFLTPLFNSTSTNKYFISEVSSDRTELRIESNILSPEAIVEGYANFVSSSADLKYFRDFYLNFGENNLVIANNTLLESGSILIKLYEPLPPQFDVKSELWVVEKLSDSIAYFFELITVLDSQDDRIQLRGPNLNIPIKNRVNNSTEYINYNTLQTSSLNNPTGSLTNQLNNILNNKSIRLNIDYSDYNNFVHFSSAETRLENFVYKLSLIDSYNISYLSSSTVPNNYYLTSSQNIYLNKIKDIVENFDGYEYHLYFNSGSTSWPKTNTSQPYNNYSSTASQGLAWLTGQLDSASLYDSENKDFLLNTVPLYLKEDPQNAPYELFVEMLGQHFDTLYLYSGELTNKYNSDNRINYGSSKDLISDILKDFGIKIYQNNFSTNDLYTSFLGINPGLGLLPPTGSELITTYVSASNQVIPLDDSNAELYKRIYHNLPLLLKKKGTIAGLRLLINTYGIPDTILRISEFGGKNRNNSNDWDQFQNQFNYAFFTTSSGFLKYDILTSQSFSESLSVEFRFKTNGLPSSSYSQSLAYFEPDFNCNVVLEYTGSGNLSGSYTSSIVNPENLYGTVKLINGSNNSCSVYLPVFDGGWWSVLLTLNSASNCTSSLYVKNNIYDGYDGNQIGFQASASLLSGSAWIPTSQSFYLSYPIDRTIAGKKYRSFSGSFQELRFYKTLLSESVFNDYVMNPYSIEGNQLSGSQSSLDSLIFRAPLGSDLEIISGSSKLSIHPAISKIFPTQSFVLTGSSIYTLSGSYSFVPNREIIYLDQFPAGIKNIISSKVKIENNILPNDSGSTLSAFRSIQQKFPISESYTRDVNYLEVAFSPQNEINDDIISQLGYFNIGNLIGDPRDLANTTASFYPNFNKLRDIYFSKYSSSYNTNDYIRLIKYFDNSLFKLIKDFVPARTSLASGVVIKQHLLERNRHSPAQVDYEFQDYSGSVQSFPYGYYTSSRENVTGSTQLYRTIGGSAGIVPNLNGKISSSFNYPGAINITQSWSESFNGPLGLSSISHNSQDEFYNGEFKGAYVTMSTQSLNNNPYLNAGYSLINYNAPIFFKNNYENNYNYVVPKDNVDYIYGNSWGFYPPYAFPNQMGPIYSNSPYLDQYNYFLSTPTRQGEIFIYTDPNNVTFIKISKTDSLGNDILSVLSNIDSLSITYTNNAKTSYSLTLYSVSSTDITYTSLSNQIFNYNDGFQSDYEVRGTIGDIAFTNIQYKPLIITASYNPFGYHGVQTSVNQTGSFSIYSIPTASDFYPTGSRNILVNFTLNAVSTASVPTATTEVTLNISFIKNVKQLGQNINGHTFANGESGMPASWNFVKPNNLYARKIVSSTEGNGVGIVVQYTGSFVYPVLESCSITPYITAADANWNLKNISFTMSYNLPVTIGNILPISPSPYFTASLPNFINSEYDVLINNADKIKDNQYYQKVITNGYKVENNYFNLIINNNADKANVKDYNYLLKRSINPRYLGSRNTSDNFNTSSIVSSSLIQNDLKLNLSPSPKEAVANKYDTSIYEFNGITNPVELPNLSLVNVNQIILADNLESVSTLTKDDSDLNFAIDSAIIPGDKLDIIQYTSNEIINPNLEVVSTLLEPETCLYVLTSDGLYNSTTMLNTKYIYYNSIDAGVYKVTLDQNKNYVTGSSVSASSVVNEIATGVNNGEQWYITLYSGSFKNPLQDNPVVPLNPENYTDVLRKNGIYEIEGAINFFSVSIIQVKMPSNFTLSTPYGSGGGATGGMLIWKNKKNNNSLLVNQGGLSNVTAGNFVTKTVSPFVKQNINYITKTFGNKP